MEQHEWTGGMDWSDCPFVQRDPRYLSGALAMRSAPRVFVEGLITNHEHGHSPEQIAAMFHGLNVDEVRQIIDYWRGHRSAESIQQRMLEEATQHLIDQGNSPEEARAKALAALNAPPAVPLPTIEELEEELTPAHVLHALETADPSKGMEVDANTPDEVLDELLFGQPITPGQPNKTGFDN